MLLRFHKIIEMNGSNHVKIPSRSLSILKVENHDKKCFLCSILAHLHPCNNNDSDRVTNYRQYSDEIYIDRFDFTNGCKCTHVLQFEKMNIFSKIIFELGFYQDQKIWKYKLLPIEFSKKKLDRVDDSLIYKNHYVFIKKILMFLGSHIFKFVRRKCLSSYTSQNVSLKLKQRCEQQELTSIRPSDDTHPYFKKIYF